MLSTTFFERVTGAPRLKTYAISRERRDGGMRIDVRLKAHLCTLNQSILMLPMVVRLREMSLSGTSLLAPIKLRVGQEFLIRLEGKDGGIHWLWCRTRRCSQADGVTNIIGAVFVKLLLPDQDVRAGIDLKDLQWLDVENSDMPNDSSNSKAA